jgi:general secretion pathway protein L
MSPQLIRLLPDGRAQWRDDAGVQHEGWPPPAARRHPNVVLVPGGDVLLLQLPRPARDARQLALALPFAIEEQLAGAIEDQHVAWAPTADPSQLQVAVVSRERMAAWLAALAAAGVQADVLLPEPLALAAPARGGHRLLFERERVVWRHGSGGQSLDPREFAELPTTLALDPADCEAMGTADASPDWPEPHLRRCADALSVLADGASQPALDLLQGEYRPRHREQAQARAWRWAAALAGLALLFTFGHAWVDHAKLAQLAARQDQELRELLARVAPDAEPASDPLTELRTRLVHGARDQDGALALIARAAPALAADSRVTLESLEYRGDRLELVVQAADVAGLDALGRRLDEAGLQADIVASTPGDRGVQGRLALGATP